MTSSQATMASAAFSGERLPPAELARLVEQASQRHQAHIRAGHKLDLNRGKPDSEYLDLSSPLDGILGGDYHHEGLDTRNYGGFPMGFPAARELVAEILQVRAEETLVGGNSSLFLIAHAMFFAHHFGIEGPGTAWSQGGAQVRFLCPSPGYDRHFHICDLLGIEMIPVPFVAEGPDMEQVTELVASDPQIKGMFCVPRFSNPTGHVYSDAVVERLAGLGKVAGPGFRIIWDNAYALHAFDDQAPQLASIMERCRHHGTTDSVLLFGSTSKITFAGAGLAFMAASPANLEQLLRCLGVCMIGFDKVNQLRHLRFLRDFAHLEGMMAERMALIRRRFELVHEVLGRRLGAVADTGAPQGIAGAMGKMAEMAEMGSWSRPQGGYFISFLSRPGLAREIAALAAEAGLIITPPGASYPYGRDPDDRHLRIAPTYPPLTELRQAMEIFCDCVELATLRQQLTSVRS